MAKTAIIAVLLLAVFLMYKKQRRDAASLESIRADYRQTTGKEPGF